MEIAARMAERWYSAPPFSCCDHELRGRQPLILYASHVDFEQTNVDRRRARRRHRRRDRADRAPHRAAAGRAARRDRSRHRARTGARLPVRHDHSARRAAGHDRPPIVCRCGSSKGMAEYLSIGPRDPNTAMWLRDAARPRAAADDQGSRRARVLPVPLGPGVLGLRGRPVTATPVIQRLLTIAPAHRALRQGARTGARRDRRSAVERLARRDPQTSRCRCCIATGRELEGSAIRSSRGSAFKAELNVGPALSPDGRWLAFLSTRSLLSIDVFIADASHGRVVRKLTSTATDPHFSSIQFIHSAGTWDRGSRRLAVATVTARHGRRSPSTTRRAGRSSARSSISRRRRDPGAGVGARRQRDRLQRPARRPDRPVRLRPATGPAAPAHDRRLRRSAAVVVARRPASSRSSTDRFTTDTAKLLVRCVSGSPSSTWRADSSSACSLDIQRQGDQPAVVPRRPVAVLHLRPRRACRTCTARRPAARDAVAGDDDRHRRERHHER